MAVNRPDIYIFWWVHYSLGCSPPLRSRRTWLWRGRRRRRYWGWGVCCEFGPVFALIGGGTLVPIGTTGKSGGVGGGSGIDCGVGSLAMRLHDGR